MVSSGERGRRLACSLGYSFGAITTPVCSPAPANLPLDRVLSLHVPIEAPAVGIFRFGSWGHFAGVRVRLRSRRADDVGIAMTQGLTYAIQTAQFLL